LGTTSAVVGAPSTVSEVIVVVIVYKFEFESVDVVISVTVNVVGTVL
jgi:hypothetical protein